MLHLFLVYLLMRRAFLLFLSSTTSCFTTRCLILECAKLVGLNNWISLKKMDENYANHITTTLVKGESFFRITQNTSFFVQLLSEILVILLQDVCHLKS